MLEVCCGVTNGREKDEGARGPVRLWSEWILGHSDHVYCLSCEPIDSPSGESVSPFIDEGDGLTSERERVRMLLRFVAYAGGYRMMVGAHNTIGCQMHVRGCVVFFRYGRHRCLPHY